MKRLAALGLIFVAGASLADGSPYAGEESRQFKSLSAGEIESLRSGQGMGFAKLAELNRYPGPAHVLELADELELTPTQLQQTQDIHTEMKNAAVALGEQIIVAEAELGRHFEDGTVDAESLEMALLEIGDLRARLRNVHLQAHLEQQKILSAEQVAKYDELRGYRHGNRPASGDEGHHERKHQP